MTQRTLALLGATGSIGTSTLDVVARHRDHFHVGAVAAARNWKKLLDICVVFEPRLAAVLDAPASFELQRALRQRGLRTEVMSGVAAWMPSPTLPDATRLSRRFSG